MKKIIIILLATLCANSLTAQTRRQQTTNTHAWFMYFGNHKFSKHFGLHAEVQIRRNEFAENWQQLLLRTGLDYYASKVRYTVGYAFIETYPYGEFPVANPFPEHRIWQQALVPNSLGRVNLTHRYRLEQRMIGNAATGEFSNGRYENRFRYMCRANIILKGTTLDPGEFYVGVYDELFINFGHDVAYNIFDQNRAYAALGYHLGKIGRVEVGYMYQVLQQRNLITSTDPPKTIIENNHTLQLALISDLKLFKEKE